MWAFLASAAMQHREVEHLSLWEFCKDIYIYILYIYIYIFVNRAQGLDFTRTLQIAATSNESSKIRNIA